MKPGDFSFHLLTTAIGCSVGGLVVSLMGTPPVQVLFAMAVAFPLSLYINFRKGKEND
jgi:uncharacterized membrane protein YccC